MAWNALPNAVKDSGSLSAFIINLKRHIRTLRISTCSPCMYYRCIIVVLFNQRLVEKQVFITNERVTLNKYISNKKTSHPHVRTPSHPHDDAVTPPRTRIPTRTRARTNPRRRVHHLLLRYCTLFKIYSCRKRSGCLHNKHGPCCIINCATQRRSFDNYNNLNKTYIIAHFTRIFWHFFPRFGSISAMRA